MMTAVQMSERAQEHAHKVQLLEIENARLYEKEEADLRHEAIKLSDRVDRRETLLAAFGILSALILGLSVIGLGVYLAAFHDLEVGGSILGAGGLATLVYVFIYGSRKQRDNVQTFTLDSVEQGAEVEDRARTKDANGAEGSPDL